MTRLTRSPAGTPPHWSRGGWVNTTMSPSRTSCQLKNAFCTRIRSYTASVGTIDADGMEKTSHAYARKRTDSSAATRSVTTVSVSPRRHRRRCGPAPTGSALAGSVLAGPGSAGAGMSGSLDAQLRVACGGKSARNMPGQDGAARGELVRGAGARGRALDLRGDRAGRGLGRACRLGR